MDITETDLLRITACKFYAKSVNIMMTNLSKYFLSIKIKRLVSYVCVDI